MGKASDKVKEICNIVREAQEKAIAGMRPGALCLDVDKLARDHIESKGYGENFGHGLGHGVGLEVHEGPRLSKTASGPDETLKVGNVVTVEPGIYIPGWGGIRIEDMVAVTEDGYDVLTSADKDLVEVGS
jgi:Xaa-Pro aminopeptidase